MAYANCDIMEKEIEDVPRIIGTLLAPSLAVWPSGFMFLSGNWVLQKNVIMAFNIPPLHELRNGLLFES